ncbi:MAG: efflux RND transporter periplasmic adaptor subunit [Alphaproteobacteria bacterium]|nr:efflux RND transporter periplasmic adaptor subunit [Alphaproteobacteria bacterium]
MAEAKKSKSGRKAAIVFLILLCAAAGGGVYFFGRKEFRYAGTLEVTKVTLSSKLATDILDFPYEEGDALKEGDVIVKLNDDIYTVASKQLNNDYERAKSLREKGHISEDQFDKTERLKNENDLHIEWSEIKAPLSGTILTKFKEKGEFVSPGQPLVSMADTKNIWTYFYVEHDRVHTLHVGDKVIGTLPELPDRQFKGKIIKINEEAEFTPKNVQTRAERTRLVYGVKVRFENDDLTLKSGMTVETAFE